MGIYVVREGDSVYSIAADYGVEPGTIIYDNQLLPPYLLAIGQALYIAEERSTDDFMMRINGYAYPFITREVLVETLPYLTVLSIFSYGFTTTGELVSPALDEQWMIKLAQQNGTTPILTLTPFDQDGNFNNYLITSVVNNTSYRANLIDNLLNDVQLKNYGGVDVDFEYILSADRDAFTTFVAQLREKMNENGYVVSVALAPKTSSIQTNRLNVGLDYGGLGVAAEHVLLMTYEYGYKYGPNMAIAPLNQVRQVVEYAITQIPRFKVNLGIPNYAYDWPLPFIQGKTEAETITNVEAVRIAVRTGSIIKYDEVSQSPYFNYILNGIKHEVWFEDVRSIQAKINLIKEYDLEGAGYWQINNLFRSNWKLLYQETNINKN